MSDQSTPTVAAPDSKALASSGGSTLTVNGLEWDELHQRVWQRVGKERGSIIAGDLIAVLEAVEKELRLASNAPLELQAERKDKL